MSTLFKTTHPEDVKAAIRKKWGTVAAFQRTHGFPSTGVNDVLRGRKSQQISDAIEQLLQEQTSESSFLDCSTRAA